MFYDPDWKKTIIESHRFWTKFLWKRNRSIWEPEVIKKNSLRFVDLFWIKDKTLGSGQLHHTCKQHFRHVNFCTSTFPTLKSIRFFFGSYQAYFFFNLKLPFALTTVFISQWLNRGHIHNRLVNFGEYEKKLLLWRIIWINLKKKIERTKSKLQRSLQWLSAFAILGHLRCSYI